MFIVFANVGLASAKLSPVISSVSPITVTRLQNITIQGSGFGNTPPQTVSLGDDSVDTVDGGSTPSMQIRDNHLINGWTAGYESSYNLNAIGVILLSWSDTKIVLGGFGQALGTTSIGGWNLMPGDPIQILVKTSGGVASYSTAVVGSQNNTITTSGVRPSISSVSPISTSVVQNIVVKGSGFGNTPPQTVSLGDGSVDTVGGGATPVIQVHDDGWYGWEAGTQDGPNTGMDLVGVVLVSWSDTQIVLGGFGSALSPSSQGQYQLLAGDPIRIVVMTLGGTAEYEATVVGAGTSSNSSAAYPAPSTPNLSVSCQSSTAFSNFRVEINGSLTNNTVGVSGANILLYYSIDGGNSWQGLTDVDTGANGNFVAEWLPSVTGNYAIEAVYEGNLNYSGVSTVVNIVVAPYASENALNVFSVTSNSTISGLAFNSTSGQLAFTVSGPSGTTGYADICIAKTLVTDVSAVRVFIDGNAANYSVASTVDSWILHFTYHHSTHEVAVDLNNVDTSALSATQLAQEAVYVAVIGLGAVGVLLLFLRKRAKPRIHAYNAYTH